AASNPVICGISVLVCGGAGKKCQYGRNDGGEKGRSSHSRGCANTGFRSLCAPNDLGPSWHGDGCIQGQRFTEMGRPIVIPSEGLDARVSNRTATTAGVCRREVDEPMFTPVGRDKEAIVTRTIGAVGSSKYWC